MKWHLRGASPSFFQDGSDVDVKLVAASPDSTLFLNEKTNAMTAVPTQTIRKVVRTSAGIGFLEGFGWGAGIGAASFATIALVNGKGFAGADLLSTTLFFSAIGGAGAAVIGGIVGVSIGHSYEYHLGTGVERPAGGR